LLTVRKLPVLQRFHSLVRKCHSNQWLKRKLFFPSMHFNFVLNFSVLLFTF
jgi:hypothetical protein